jgi:hypothetical protein
MENRANSSPDKAASVRRSMGRLCALMILPPVLVISVVNLTFRNPPPADLKAWAVAAIKTHNYDRAKQSYAELIKRDPTNSTNHYRYLWAHFEQTDTIKRDDAQVWQE